MKSQLTILTATYNRAHLLPDLYRSLCRQTSKDFVWVVMDDGSLDGTRELIANWANEMRLVENGFDIQYYYQSNGGKDRAINTGVAHISTPYTMIMDSDDYLTDDAVDFLTDCLSEIKDDDSFAGISGWRAIENKSSQCVSVESLNHLQTDYVDATNLERKGLGIEKDCCEVYRTDLLKSHPFKVWAGEKFTPEEVVWNQLALEGYKLRWFNKVTCIVRYQEEVLTKDSWNLYRKNPMGYAMMFDHRLLYSHGWREKVQNVIQFLACCCLAGEYGYISHCNEPVLAYCLFPVGWLLARRRRRQFGCV